MYPRYNLQTVAGNLCNLPPLLAFMFYPAITTRPQFVEAMKLVISLTKIPTNINRLRINSLLKKNEIEEPHLKATIKMAIVCKLDE
ncbi:unnamed protein product [Lactuca virosa]|uniref:Uncharacterized protein n=1 Tax=Lactuca virosa TaxID=75947 RepID=A0AAU9P0P5_9ASTR|nr:unnamed protein product [Lactuca virosa]